MTHADRFSAAIVAASDIDCDHWKDGDAIAAAAKRVGDVLKRCGAEPLVGPSPSDKHGIEGFLEEWVAREPRDSGVLYCVGHGADVRRTGHVLVTRETGPIANTGPALVTRTLALHVARHQDARRIARSPEGGPPAWLLVILDCCKAAKGVQSIARELSDPSDEPVTGVALFGTSTSGHGYADRFATAFETVVDRYDVNDPAVKVDSLIDALTREMEPNAFSHSIHPVASAAIVNPKYHGAVIATKEDVGWLLEVMDDRKDHLRHFIAKAQGAELGEAAWHFSGREHEVADLSAWLRDAPVGLRVVTGLPGSGKSGLLGHLVVLADPLLRAVARDLGLEFSDDATTRPPDGVFDVRIHLRGKTLGEATALIAAGLPLAELGPESHLKDVLDAAQAHDGRLTIVADALDESADPLRIAARLLDPLAHEAGARVVVGTRSSLREPTGAASPTDTFVLNSLRAGCDEVMSLQPDAPAAARYVRRQLERAGIEAHVAAEVAELVDRAAPSFLVARLVGQELGARRITTVDRAVRELITADLAMLFAAACERLAVQRPATMSMLRALAFARGRGMPRIGGVWRAVAEALDGEGTLSEEDVDAVLADAATHVVVDQEHRQSVYRLAHPAFEAHLRGHDAAGAEEAIVRCLMALEAERPEPGEVSPYVVHHLAGHVASAECWEILAHDPQLLDRLEPRSVAGAARAMLGTVDLPEAIVGVLGSEHQRPSAGRPANRLGLRQLGMARSVGRRAFAPDAIGADWAVRSAVLRLRSPHLRLDTRHAPRALVAFDGPDGDPVVAAACADGAVRMWDALSGAPFGELVTEHEHRFAAMCVFAGDGARPQVAVVDRAGRVELWDPLDGKRSGRFQALSNTSAITGWLVGSATRVATAGADGRVRVWDPRNADEPLEVLGNHGVPIVTLTACTLQEDVTWLVGAGHGDAVSVWRFDADGRPSGAVRELTAHTDWVRAIAFSVDGARMWTAGDDGTVRSWSSQRFDEAATVREGGAPVMALAAYEDGGARLVSGSRDGTVQVWDVEGSAKEIASRALSNGAVIAMSSFAVGGRPHVATAVADDCTVTVFDPARIAPAADAGPVCEVATAVSDAGAGGVLTGGTDGRLWLWDADTGDSLAHHPVVHGGSVHAIVRCRTAAGADGVAVGGADELVRFVDPRSGAEIQEPLRGHTDAVRAIVSLPGAEGMLVSGGQDGTLRLWDAATGREHVEARRRYDGPVRGVCAWSQTDGSEGLAVVGPDREVRILPAPMDPGVDAVLEGSEHAAWVMTVCRYGDACSRQRLATGGDDTTIRLWDPLARRSVGAPLIGHKHSVRGVIALGSPYATRLVSASLDRTVRVWDPETSKELQRLELDAPVFSLTALGDAAFVAGTGDGHVVVDLMEPGGQAGLPA